MSLDPLDQDRKKERRKEERKKQRKRKKERIKRKRTFNQTLSFLSDYFGRGRQG